MSDWPKDADGDVLRGLEADGFDFSQTVEIDFNLDFDAWPPSQEAVAAITAAFPTIAFLDPDEEDIAEGETIGFAQFTLEDTLSYELVMKTQREASAVAAPFGGRCESWGLAID